MTLEQMFSISWTLARRTWIWSTVRCPGQWVGGASLVARTTPRRTTTRTVDTAPVGVAAAQEACHTRSSKCKHQLSLVLRFHNISNDWSLSKKYFVLDVAHQACASGGPHGALDRQHCVKDRRRYREARGHGESQDEEERCPWTDPGWSHWGDDKNV